MASFPGARYFGTLDHPPDNNGDDGNGPWTFFHSD